ncbi:hypothetical protein ACPYPG_30170 [Streptomyces sp. FR-108]|uniref:hypothetical protein n=1 Tax=Streptomyces sp. FR-108 TaxID=3416665 RepID=UPI003CF59135
MVAEIKKFGFESPVGKVLEHRVITKGLAVMKYWVFSNKIWSETAASLGYRGESCWSREEALTLIYDSVHKAWRRFMKNIKEGDWDPTKSSLQTSFLNKCKIAFVEEYRAWRKRSRPDAMEILVPMGSAEYGDYGGSTHSADESVVQRDLARYEMGRMPLRTAQILAMQAEGYSLREIAHHMGATIKGVEGVINRWRKEQRGGGPHA